MTGNEIQKFALNIAAKLPKAELDYPFGSEIHVYKIMGKVFMLVFDLNGKKMVNLKVRPEHGEMLRDVYESIHTGYHMNNDIGFLSMKVNKSQRN